LGKKRDAILELDIQGSSESLSALVKCFRTFYLKGQYFDLLELATELSGDVHDFFHHFMLSKTMTVVPSKVEQGVAENANNKGEIFGWTLFHYGAAKGNEIAVQVLLKNGADPNTTDLSEWTPMHYAIQDANGLERPDSENEMLESIMWALLRSGADTKIRGRDGIAPLHCAARLNGKATEILSSWSKCRNSRLLSKDSPPLGCIH